MLTVIKAGTTYFSVVFAVGFLLGVVRILLLVPLVGEALAVLIELPIMIVISWIACSQTIGYFSIPAHFFKRLAIGVLAFALLLGAEFWLATGFFDQTPQHFLSGLRTMPGAIGLVGQSLFALFPILQVNIGQISRAISSS